MSKAKSGHSSTISRARAYARRHGLRAVAREFYRRYLFSRSPYYVYVCPHTLTAADVPEPRVDGFHAVLVTSNSQAEELARAHEDFRRLDRNAVSGLERGAIACCLYSGQAVASLSWCATTNDARRAIDSIGFPLDAATGGAWTGRVHTFPEYERKGLFRFACALRFDYLNAMGIDKSSTAIAPGNVPSHAMAARLGCNLSAKGEVVRLLRWRWWRTTRVTHGDSEAIGAMVAAVLKDTDSRSR
jgi:RimJ/RimL family protein N-acetyltransferase